MRDDRLRTEDLITKLHTSPTDLGKLVQLVLRRGCPVVGIPAAGIDRWMRVDPQSWGLVREWLAARGTTIVIVEPSSAG